MKGFPCNQRGACPSLFKRKKKFAIWRNHKVIGYCEITEKARQRNNGATNAEFYIGYDPVTKPEMYK